MRPAAYVIMLPLCAAYVVPFRVPLRTSPPTLARHVLPVCREEPAVTNEVDVSMAADAIKATTGQPATLQFSAFRGYYVVLDGGAEVLIRTHRVGKGLQMGDRVLYCADADESKPLVVTFVEPMAAPKVMEELVVVEEEEEQEDATADLDGSPGPGTASVEAAVVTTDTAPEEVAEEVAEEVVVPVPAAAPAPVAVPAPAAVPVPVRNSLDRKEVLALALGLTSACAFVVSKGLSEAGKPPPEPSAWAEARAEAVRAQAQAKSPPPKPSAWAEARAEAERAQAQAKIRMAEQEAAEAAAAVEAAAAAEAAEAAVVAASWIVQWSIPGLAPYFLNTHTGAVTWNEPRKGLLTAESLREAKAAAIKAAAEDSFAAQRAYNMLERLNECLWCGPL